MFESIVAILCGVFVLSVVVNLGFSLGEFFINFLRKKFPKLNDYLPSWRLIQDKWKLMRSKKDKN